MIHCTYKTNPTVIGDDVTIGHGAVVHGCQIKNLCLIGMNAVVLDKAVVNDYCIIAAGSVVLEGQVLEEGHLYAGVPAKKIKPLTDAQKQLLHQSAKGYVMYADWYGED
jgi:carbonic anhydrase/acetyltransferase-like protein (isoleucine patch superfamily)